MRKIQFPAHINICLSVQLLYKKPRLKINHSSIKKEKSLRGKEKQKQNEIRACIKLGLKQINKKSTEQTLLFTTKKKRSEFQQDIVNNTQAHRTALINSSISIICNCILFLVDIIFNSSFNFFFFVSKDQIFVQYIFWTMEKNSVKFDFIFCDYCEFVFVMQFCFVARLHMY